MKNKGNPKISDYKYTQVGISAREEQTLWD
jgi:hypothetical protein